MNIIIYTLFFFCYMFSLWESLVEIELLSKWKNSFQCSWYVLVFSWIYTLTYSVWEYLFNLKYYRLRVLLNVSVLTVLVLLQLYSVDYKYAVWLFQFFNRNFFPTEEIGFTLMLFVLFWHIKHTLTLWLQCQSINGKYVFNYLCGYLICSANSY